MLIKHSNRQLIRFLSQADKGVTHNQREALSFLYVYGKLKEPQHCKKKELIETTEQRGKQCNMSNSTLINSCMRL